MLVYQRVTDLNPLRQRPCISDPVSFDAHGLLRAQFPCRIFPRSRDDATGRPTPQDNWIPKDAEMIAEFQGNQRDCWDGLVGMWGIDDGLRFQWTCAILGSEHWILETEQLEMCFLELVHIKHKYWNMFFYHKISLLIDNKFAMTSHTIHVWYIYLRLP